MSSLNIISLSFLFRVVAMQSTSGERDALLQNKDDISKSKRINYASTRFFNEVTPMTLAWHNIRVIRDKPTPNHIILDEIHGKAVPKEVVALMGAR